MHSKIWKLIACFTIVQICLYACCTDINHIFINTVDFTVRDIGDTDISSVANEDFSLLVKIDYERETVASLTKKSGLINMAYATSCDDEFIITKRVTNIELFADVPLSGIDAGNPLNDHVLVGYGFVSNSDGFTITDMIAALNYEQTNRSEEYYLTFDSLISAGTSVNFNIVFTFENGEQLERAATTVTFE